MVADLALVIASKRTEIGMLGALGASPRTLRNAFLWLGGMLAGGCAVGAGLSGAAIFTATSWVTLSAMWAAAALTDRIVDRRPVDSLDQAVPGIAPSHAGSRTFA